MKRGLYLVATLLVIRKFLKRPTTISKTKRVSDSTRELRLEPIEGEEY